MSNRGTGHKNPRLPDRSTPNTNNTTERRQIGPVQRTPPKITLNPNTSKTTRVMADVHQEEDIVMEHQDLENVDQTDDAGQRVARNDYINILAAEDTPRSLKRIAEDELTPMEPKKANVNIKVVDLIQKFNSTAEMATVDLDKMTDHVEAISKFKTEDITMLLNRGKSFHEAIKAKRALYMVSLARKRPIEDYVVVGGLKVYFNENTGLGDLTRNRLNCLLHMELHNRNIRYLSPLLMRINYDEDQAENFPDTTLVGGGFHLLPEGYMDSGWYWFYCFVLDFATYMTSHPECKWTLRQFIRNANIASCQTVNNAARNKKISMNNKIDNQMILRYSDYVTFNPNKLSTERGSNLLNDLKEALDIADNPNLMPTPSDEEDF